MSLSTLPDKTTNPTDPNESNDFFNNVYGSGVARGINEAEQHANNPTGDKKSVQEQEAAPDKPGGFKNNFTGKQKITGKGSFLKKKGPLGLIITIIIGGSLGMGGLFSGAGVLLNAVQNIKDSMLNSMPTVNENRGRSIMRGQLNATNKATKGICTPVSVRCRFETMSDRQVRLLEAAGVKVNTDGKALGIKRSRVASLEYKGKTINAANLSSERLNDSSLNKAISKSFNSRLVSFASTPFTKVLSAIGSTKVANLAGKKLSEMKQSMLDRVTGMAQATADAGITPKKDDKGKIIGYVDETGASLTVAQGEAKMGLANERFANALKLKKSATSTTEFFTKSSVKSTLIGVGAVSVACSAWNIVRTAAAASRYLGAIQLANYSYIFLNGADMLRAGDGTPELAEFLGNTLTKPNSAGMAAMDSRGMKYALYGDVSPIPSPSVEADSNNNPTDASVNTLNLDSEVTQYVNGAGVSKSTNNAILDKIPGVRKESTSLTYQAADTACGYINSSVGTGLMLGAGVIMSVACGVSAFFTVGATGGACLADVGYQLAFAGIMAGAIFGLQLKLASVFSNTVINGNENGNQSGNAMISGVGALGAQAGVASGLGYMSKPDAASFQAVKDQTSNEFAAIDRSDYNPLDGSNTNTFVGKIVTTLIPYISKASSISSSLLSITKIPLMSFSSLFNTAKAASPQGDAGVCDDGELEAYATDINCNPIVGQTQHTLNLDIDTVLDYMINNKHIDETSGAAVSPEYQDYITYCTERKTAFGTYPEGETPSDKNTGKICQDGYKGPNGDMYDMFRAYISYRIAEEGLSGEPMDGSAPAADTTASTTPVSGDVKSLAKQIYDSPNIQFQTPQEKIDFKQIVDTGSQTACGGSVPISSSLLSLILTASQKYKLTIGVVASGHSCNGGYHPKGQAVDINGVALLDQPFLQRFDWTSGQIGIAKEFYRFADATAGKMGIKLELGQQQCFPGSPPPVSNSQFVPDVCNHIHVGVTSF